jgi:release factor glutamine methyltransferase
VAEILGDGAAVLEASGLTRADAKVDVEVLARHVLGWDRATLLLRRAAPPPVSFQTRLATLIARRVAREPVAYITGRREFWGLDFEVTPAVLIPRPETELVVEAAQAWLQANARPASPAVVLDIGTGSGCLGAALAHDDPDLRVIASDVSLEALAVARCNIARHGLGSRVRLVAADLLTAFASARFADLVVSNPPYVADDSPDVADDVRRFEPAMALFSGPAGLEHIERIVASAGQVLRPGGALVFEFGQGQAEAIGMRLDAEGWIVREIKRDLQGIPRVAVATRAR